MPRVSFLRRRAHPSWRARLRSIPFVLARSRGFERAARWLITLVIIAGLVATTGGLASEVSGFSTDLKTLVNYAGGSDTVLSSTLDMFQTQVLNLLGLGSPDPSTQEVAQVPDMGRPQPTYSAELPTGEGLVPYQVEMNGDTPLQHAPALPTETLSPTQAATAGALVMPIISAGDIPAATGTASPTETPEPTLTPSPPAVPGWIEIPVIGLDAPVVVSTTHWVTIDGKTFAQWEAPNLFAAGWQEGSAPLGVPGNTVLNGHHNIYGEVFGKLYQLNQGDEIIVYSGDRTFHYAVAQVMKIEERNASLAQREENARWVLPSTDERLTLVTCWPPNNNTYRLIVVAVPLK